MFLARKQVNDLQKAGYNRIKQDSSNNQCEEVGSGMFFYNIKVGEFTQSKKMVILK